MRLFWIAIVLFAALLPVATIVVCAFFVVLGLMVSDATSRPHRAADLGSDAQPVALLALSRFRAPPVRALFA